MRLEAIPAFPPLSLSTQAEKGYVYDVTLRPSSQKKKCVCSTSGSSLTLMSVETGGKTSSFKLKIISLYVVEPSVRAELMEQVPHVAMYCHEEKDEHQWMHLVPSFLLPLVVRYLTDANNQVRFFICFQKRRSLI